MQRTGGVGATFAGFSDKLLAWAQNNSSKECETMGGIGTTEIIIVLIIVVLIFGVGKVADLGPALGKAISGFRKAVKEDQEEPESKEEPDSENKD
jgi:sec-independent protein translocase protein TatA